MALTTAVLNAGADGAAAVLAWAAIHSDATDASQTSDQRIQITWDPATGAVAAAGNTPLAFTGTASGPATHVGIWDQDQPGGTMVASGALTGDQTFNAAGQYNVTAATVTATDET